MINDLEKLKSELEAKTKQLNGLIKGFTKDIDNFTENKEVNKKLKEILDESVKGNSPDLTEIQKIINDADRVNNPE